MGQPHDFGRLFGVVPQEMLTDCLRSGSCNTCMWDDIMATGVWVFEDPAAVDQGDPCNPEPDPTVGFRAQDLVSWTEQLPGVRVLDRRTVKVGDVEGLPLRISVDPAGTATCPDWHEPGVALFTERHPHRTLTNHEFATAWFTGDATSSWFVFADVDVAHTVGIHIVDADESELDGLLVESLPIIGSLTFAF